MKKQLLVDTDPGHDDALALMLLAGCASVEIQHITTVAGNASVEKTTRNARAILGLIKREDIPVFSGAEKPLHAQQVFAEVHGETGLDGVDLRGYALERTQEDATEQILQAIHHAPPESLTLITLGPLTNIAKALMREPLILTRVKETIIMGGAISVPGNQNRVAEFNICTDPHAAARVFLAPGRKVLIPLDLCNTVVLHLADLDSFPHTKTLACIRSMLKPYIQNIKQFIGAEGALLYDPIAAFYAISPNSFTVTPMDICIETEGVHTSGMTVAEKRSLGKRRENVFVATGLVEDEFFEAFFKSIRSLP